MVHGQLFLTRSSVQHSQSQMQVRSVRGDALGLVQHQLRFLKLLHVREGYPSCDHRPGMRGVKLQCLARELKGLRKELIVTFVVENGS